MNLTERIKLLVNPMSKLTLVDPGTMTVLSILNVVAAASTVSGIVHLSPQTAFAKKI